MVNVSRLNAANGALSHAKRYQATSAGALKRLLETLAIDYGNYTFIDIGAGKGRVLLVASLFPFRRIIGVEFDMNLCRTAEANIERYHPSERLCWDVRVLHADAAAFAPPDGPLIVYLYNPFDAVMLRRVVENLRPALVASAEMSLIIYVQPDHRNVLDESSFLRIECDNHHALIYRAVAAQGLEGRG